MFRGRKRGHARVCEGTEAVLVREGVGRLLELEPDIELAAACSDLPSLLDAIEAKQPMSC